MMWRGEEIEGKGSGVRVEMAAYEVYRGENSRSPVSQKQAC